LKKLLIVKGNLILLLKKAPQPGEMQEDAVQGERRFYSRRLLPRESKAEYKLVSASAAGKKSAFLIVAYFFEDYGLGLGAVVLFDIISGLRGYEQSIASGRQPLPGQAAIRQRSFKDPGHRKACTRTGISKVEVISPDPVQDLLDAGRGTALKVDLHLLQKEAGEELFYKIPAGCSQKIIFGSARIRDFV